MYSYTSRMTHLLEGKRTERLILDCAFGVYVTGGQYNAMKPISIDGCDV